MDDGSGSGRHRLRVSAAERDAVVARLTTATDVFSLGPVSCFAAGGRPYGEGPTDAML